MRHLSLARPQILDRPPTVTEAPPTVTEAWIVAPTWECSWVGIPPDPRPVTRIRSTQHPTFGIVLIRVDPAKLPADHDRGRLWEFDPEQQAMMGAASWCYCLRETHLALSWHAEPMPERCLVQRLLALELPGRPLVYNAKLPGEGACLTCPATGEHAGNCVGDPVPESIRRGMGWDIPIDAALIREAGPWRPGLDVLQWQGS